MHLLHHSIYAWVRGAVCEARSQGQGIPHCRGRVWALFVAVIIIDWLVHYFAQSVPFLRTCAVLFLAVVILATILLALACLAHARRSCRLSTRGLVILDHLLYSGFTGLLGPVKARSRPLLPSG